MVSKNIGENALTLLILAAIFYLIYLRTANSTFKESVEKIKKYFQGD